ncbi:MAG: DUF3592 domain-containing protein [Deltaproteobacteria bacterium]|nr:DUF3592 domain-containing protein [Deltaproteobacteria bacterium]
MSWLGSLVLGCALVVAGAGILTWRWWLESQVVKVRGVVGQIRLAVASSTAGGPTVIVRFRAHDGSPHVFESKGKQTDRLQAGRPVEVRYPKDHPERAVVAEREPSLALPLVLVCAGAVCIAASFALR